MAWDDQLYTDKQIDDHLVLPETEEFRFIAQMLWKHWSLERGSRVFLPLLNLKFIDLLMKDARGSKWNPCIISFYQGHWFRIRKASKIQYQLQNSEASFVLEETLFCYVLIQFQPSTALSCYRQHYFYW